MPLLPLLVLASLPTSAASVELLAGVIADDTTRSVYLMAEEDRIEALDTRTGELRWTSEAGARPLALVGRHLVALRDRDDQGRLPVVVLDVEDGSLARRCGAIQLPEGAPGIDEALGASTTTWATVEADRVVIRWSTRTWYMGGPEPTPDIEAASRSHRTGALTCTPATGKAGPAEEAAEPVHPAPVGYLDLVTAAGIQPPDNLAFAARSLDGEHLLLAHRTEPDNRYDTQLWALSGPRLLQSFEAGPYGARFVVQDGVLLQLGASREHRRPVVVASDVATGGRIWEQGFRQTAYDGPIPP